MKKQFKSRKEVTEYLKEKGIDTSNWDEVKWQSFNKGQAEIHIMALAEAMWDAMNESTPKKLKAGEWHIPFGESISEIDILDIMNDNGKFDNDLDYQDKLILNTKIKIATARCARVSYTVVGEENKEANYIKDIELHNTLVNSGHWSPFEHCAKAMSNEEYKSFIKGELIVTHSEPDYEDLTEFSNSSIGWCNNFKGFIQYRKIIENEIL